jgi:hypothetical protein
MNNPPRKGLTNEVSMTNLIKHEKAEEFLWIYISDYLAGKIDKPEANALIAAMFDEVVS